MPHEVVATADGGLDVKLPKEYEHVFEKPVAWDYIPVLGNAELHGDRLVEMDSVSTCTYGFLGHNEESYMLKCKIMPREVYDHFGILLKSDKEASGCLLLEFDVAMQRVSLVNLLWELTRSGFSPVRLCLLQRSRALMESECARRHLT